MTQYMFRPICTFCKHFDGEAMRRNPSVWRCRVFPERIPTPILILKYDHREPYKGDNGITFEKAEKPHFDPHPDNAYLLDIFLELHFRFMDKLRVEGQMSPPLDPKTLAGKLSYEEYFEYFVQMGQQKSTELAPAIPPEEATP